MTDIKEIIDYLRNYDGERISLMEVCGTHTAAISESGITDIISDKIRLVSGPGCPVCVTASAYIDRLIELAVTENTCVVTFGDMIRVKGSTKSLRDISAEGGNVVMVYSPLDVIPLAEKNRDITYVFAAVGFETTTPVYALLIEEACSRGLNNIKILTALKTMPAAIEKVYYAGKCIDGFIAPGHVSVITGSEAFVPVAERLSVPFVVAGFTGEELLAAIYALVRSRGRGIVLNMYKSAVTEHGNDTAKKMVAKYFMPCDAAWRGMGIIKDSGLILRPEYAEYDAGSEGLTEDIVFNKGCSCGEVVAGLKSPAECALYHKACTPSSPQGACMVSTEGACYHYYVNNRK